MNRRRSLLVIPALLYGIFITPADAQEEKVSAIFTSAGWAVETILNDYTSRPRIISARLAE